MESFVAVHLPTTDSRLEIADVGGGLGQFSILFAEQGHDVQYFDLSSKMCAHMRHEVELRGLDNIFVNEGYFQQALWGRTFDVVFCHAVLEWLEDPLAGLQRLAQSVRPGGLLIVVFYNKRALQFKNLIKGNWRAASALSFAGDRNSLTPISPIDPDVFAMAVSALGGTVVDKMGVRTFSEYVVSDRTNNHSDADFITMEKAVCRQEPYLSMARYVAWAVRF